ncbi:galactofuranose ABC transporter, permease protein YjfF [Telmatospirillum siberiense]|uniref:Sugar ABC transporter permease YjfF n=1 Tax=Telmatospirillum siberiense TaxID=382514 RepID=A0A2N3PZB5_9PROT|nr:galactofuranose ABC transporter, permease protein YjfF [Telmatospirillum siberiense]PKU25725.1 sugar ABC transporter permease YjfF [Telmatospirillum siberiense]
MIRRFLPLLATTVIFLLGYLYCSLQFHNFATVRVMLNLLTDNAFLGIIAVGMTFVILSGGIDLSVGSVIAFTTVFLAIAIGHWHLPPLLAFVFALALGAGFGALMGLCIHYLDIPAFIITLAGMFLARGVSFLLTTDSLPIDHPFYSQLNDISLPVMSGRLSLIAMVMLLVFVVGGILAHRTRFGADVFALGGNLTSARLMGVPVGRTMVLIYTLSGFLAALAGIVFSLYTQAGYPLAATGTEMDAIAAVVIGGTLLTGGYGYVFGTFIGVLMQGLIQTFITFDGTLSSWWTKIAVGALLFAFIGFQRLLLVLWSSKGSASVPA